MRRLHDHYVICDRCGRQRWRSDCRKDWKGLIVCADTCYEPRHPQESLRVRPNHIAVTDPRPPKTTYLEWGDVTVDDL